MFSTKSKGSNDQEVFDEAMEKIRKLGYKKVKFYFSLKKGHLLYVLRSVIQSLPLYILFYKFYNLSNLKKKTNFMFV